MFDYNVNRVVHLRNQHRIHTDPYKIIVAYIIASLTWPLYTVTKRKTVYLHHY
jgi:hypothetical protein